MRAGRLLLVLAALVGLLATPSLAEAKLRFRSCKPLPCARLAVPLDRSGSTPGRISLYVERRRAARRPGRGVTLLLAGGPGQAATAAYAGSYSGFGALTPRNDVVAFDPRGTGRSGLLRCRALERASLVDAGRAAALCAERLGQRRAFYRTSDAVDDIESLRRALGVERITLIGVSYGTLVAQAYAARYPDRVERVLLDSVLDVSGWDPLYRDIFRAVPRVLQVVCRGGCGRFTQDPVADLAQLVARMNGGPLRGRVTLPNGRRRRVSLTKEELFFTLVAGDLDDISRSAFPAAVSSALRGDEAPLLRLARRAVVSEGAGSPREFSTALYAATSCEEIPFPWQRFSDPATRLGAVAAAVAQIPAAELYPFDAATAARNDFIQLCRRWPEASPAPLAPPPGPLPDVPVLMLSGEVDLRTPVEASSAAVGDWPSARLLVATNTGHSVLGADLSGCATRATRRFFRGGSVPERCGRRRALFPVTAPLPTSLGALPPLRGVAGVRGRLLRAVQLTLFDVAEDALASLLTGSTRVRGGGLRGGRWEWERAPLRLHRVEVIRGVRVSGVILRFGLPGQRGRLRLSGPAGPDGMLRLRGGRVSGRLGGKPVRARILGELEAAAASGSETRSLARLLRTGRELAQRPRQR